MTTKLEVLNHVIAVVGEAPVSSYASTLPTAIQAKVFVERIDKETQARGWWFNEDIGLTLSPNLAGEIVLPSTTMRVRITDASLNLVQRGMKLYDTVKHSYTIDTDVTVDLLTRLTLDDLPELATSYIQHRAAYEFYSGDDGDTDKCDRLLQLATDAWTYLKKEDLAQRGPNALQRPMVAYIRQGMRQQGAGYNPRYPGGRA